MKHPWLRLMLLPITKYVNIGKQSGYVKCYYKKVVKINLCKLELFHDKSVLVEQESNSNYSGLLINHILALGSELQCVYKWN